MNEGKEAAELVPICEAPSSRGGGLNEGEGCCTATEREGDFSWMDDDDWHESKEVILLEMVWPAAVYKNKYLFI